MHTLFKALVLSRLDYVAVVVARTIDVSQFYTLITNFIFNLHCSKQYSFNTKLSHYMAYILSCRHLDNIEDTLSQ